VPSGRRVSFECLSQCPGHAGRAGADDQAAQRAAWQRLSAGEGTKGPRLYNWAYLELADLDADEYQAGATGLWTRGLLIWRNHRRWQVCLLHHLVPGRNHGRDAGCG
jgi:SRSO17 transposase